MELLIAAIAFIVLYIAIYVFIDVRNVLIIVDDEVKQDWILKLIKKGHTPIDIKNDLAIKSTSKLNCYYVCIILRHPRLKGLIASDPVHYSKESCKTKIVNKLIESKSNFVHPRRLISASGIDECDLYVVLYGIIRDLIALETIN